MPHDVEQSRVRRLRRRAQNQGWLLRKCRRRNPDAEGHGLWTLVKDTKGNHLPGAQAALSDFDNGHGVTLDEVANYLGARKR